MNLVYIKALKYISQVIGTNHEAWQFRVSYWVLTGFPVGFGFRVLIPKVNQHVKTVAYTGLVLVWFGLV
jgi:hypothetical protein